MKPTLRDALLILAGLVVGALAVFGYGWLNSAAALAVIDAPTHARPGELVLIDGSRSRGQLWTWTLAPDVQRRDLQDGRQVVLMPTGQLAITLAVQSAQGGRLTGSTASWVILPGDAPVPPGPVPPGPTPPVPPAPSTLADAARVAAMKLPAAGRAAQAKTAAEVYRLVASQITSGILTTTVEVKAETLEQLEVKLGANRRAWQPCLVEIGKATIALLPENAAIDKVREAWEQIAAGLDGVT